MPNEIQNAAERVAQQMPTADGPYGFAWVTLLVPIITEALNCLFNNDDVTPEQVQSRVRTMQLRNPARLKRRMANAATKAARRQGHKISRLEAEQIADAAIADCLTQPASAVESAGFSAKAVDTGDDT
jgi:hypothetical protein